MYLRASRGQGRCGSPWQISAEWPPIDTLFVMLPWAQSQLLWAWVNLLSLNSFFSFRLAFWHCWVLGQFLCIVRFLQWFYFWSIRTCSHFLGSLSIWARILFPFVVLIDPLTWLANKQRWQIDGWQTDCWRNEMVPSFKVFYMNQEERMLSRKNVTIVLLNVIDYI